jgi:hypothetical protein
MANLEKNRVIFWGGDDKIVPDAYNDDAWIFDLMDSNWIKLNVNTSPHYRYRHGIAKIDDNKIFMFGGIEYDTLLDDTWLLTIEPYVSVIDINNINYFETKLINKKDNIILKYKLSKPDNISFKLLDITGRVIESYNPEFKNEGEEQQIFNTSHLVRGIYYIYIFW